MKNLISLLILLTLVSCARDVEDAAVPVLEVPERLVIDDLQGIRLGSLIVSQQVNINTKLPEAGMYRIKIYDFSGKLVNQEKLKGVKGDNILNIYVSSLPKSSYTVELRTMGNELIGRELFSVIR
jgi:hypothetical protein